MKGHYTCVQTDEFVALLDPDGELLRVGWRVCLYGQPANPEENFRIENVMSLLLREHSKS